MKAEGQKCNCIRCREYGHRRLDGYSIGEPKLVRRDYEASEGYEVFLSYEDENETLFGLLRLRVQTQDIPPLSFPSGNRVIIRELHVFGPEVPIKGQRSDAAQHKGIGKALMKEAERVAREEFRASRLAILSGVGAREYYRTEFGYTLENGYMVKEL